MDEYRVILTDRAAAEFEAAYEWLWERNRAAADRWLAGFEAAIADLARNPERHGLAPETGRYPVQLRQLLYGRKRNYRALFCIRDNAVTVMAIRHTSQMPLSDVD